MRGVIYARYSSDNQREESIVGQIRENTAYANKNALILSERILIGLTQQRPITVLSFRG